jgi:phytoene dehydrogenase-like protein
VPPGQTSESRAIRIRRFFSNEGVEVTENEFDVVVVGAGFAGLCCAGTLVEKGVRVALVSETREVGWNLRPQMVAGNRGFIQHPFWQSAWDGGWWYPLARALNVPFQFEFVPPVDILIRGSKGPREMSLCSSASGLFDMFAQLAPIPIEPMRNEFEGLFQEGLRWDWRDLMAKSDVPLREWLAERDVSPAVQALLYLFAGNIMETTPEMGAEHLSVFGLFGLLRGIVCAEAPSLTIKPDVWSGLLVPMGKAIERAGGSVLRGTKVDKVLIEGGRAVGLTLRDGRELKAKAVAIATGTSRVPALLPQMPDEVRVAVDYAAQLEGEDVCIYVVLGRPVVTMDHWGFVLDESGSYLEWFSPIHKLAPWATQPGKQFIVAQTVWTPEDFAKLGGQAAIVERMMDLNEEIFPGFKEATEAIEVQHHRHLWMVPFVHGPKLPRCTKEVPGLWFVGDGSSPVVGMGVEAAAGAGVLGARDILAALRSETIAVATGL